MALLLMRLILNYVYIYFVTAADPSKKNCERALTFVGRRLRRDLHRAGAAAAEATTATNPESPPAARRDWSTEMGYSFGADTTREPDPDGRPRGRTGGPTRGTDPPTN